MRNAICNPSIIFVSRVQGAAPLPHRSSNSANKHEERAVHSQKIQYDEVQRGAPRLINRLIEVPTTVRAPYYSSTGKAPAHYSIIWALLQYLES